MLTLYIADVERDAGMKNLSRKEAAKVLEDMKVKIEIPKAAVTQWKRNTALDMAIEALVAQDVTDMNDGDMIYRQEAIDALSHMMDTDGFRNGWTVSRANVDCMLRSLPSAQSNLRPTCNQLATDCISRQAAIDAVRHAWAKGLEPTQFLEDLPSAQPERKTGKWINAYPDIEPNPMFMYGICSECGFEQSISDKLNYCPNCGAGMRGERDELNNKTD